jgi:hypothetical protein
MCGSFPTGTSCSLPFNTLPKSHQRECGLPLKSGSRHRDSRRQPIGTDKVLFIVNSRPPRLIVVNIKTHEVGVNRVVEYDKNLKEIRSYDISKPWAALRLKNGNTLITDERDIITREVNPKKKTVWEVSKADLPDRYGYGDSQSVTRLANGNTSICSRGGDRRGLRLVEVAPNKKVVWVFRDWQLYGLDRFTYQPETNPFEFPEGKKLKYRGIKPAANRSHLYRSTEAQCRGWLIKAECTSGPYKQLVIHADEEVWQRARLRNQEPDFFRHQRSRKKIEALFGELKNRICLRRARLRRQKYVRQQFLMAATAQNLKCLVRFLASMPPPRTNSAIKSTLRSLRPLEPYRIALRLRRRFFQQRQISGHLSNAHRIKNGNSERLS